MFDSSDLVAGATCLDFVNTVGGDREGISEEKIVTYADLVGWAALAGVLDGETAALMLSAAMADPVAADKALTRAKEFREALHGILLARVRGQVPPARAVESLNRRVADAMSHATLTMEGDLYRWRWPGSALDLAIWPICYDAAELLQSASLRRLHVCSGEICGWLFLDMTKNGSRRWCAMRGCGNRAKTRRYRGRQKTAV